MRKKRDARLYHPPSRSAVTAQLKVLAGSSDPSLLTPREIDQLARLYQEGRLTETALEMFVEDVVMRRWATVETRETGRDWRREHKKLAAAAAVGGAQ